MATMLQKSRRWGSKFQVREALGGYLYIMPWLLGLVLFTVGPMGSSIYLSLTDYRIVGETHFVGLDNYEMMFLKDIHFWPSLGKTLTYSFYSVTLGVSLSLLAAILLNQGLTGTSVYRLLFYIPSLTPAVCAAVIWKWAFHPTIGLMNTMLLNIGIEGPRWIYSSKWAIPSLVFISLWSGVGGNRMIIFLAGLQGVPRSLYDSASIDGAAAWAKFRHITLPMISPTVFFNVIMGMIGALKVFTTAFMTTKGGPNYATWFYALHLYNSAFANFDMGYACALAWFLMLVTVIFTGIQFLASSRWVYYAGEVR